MAPEVAPPAWSLQILAELDAADRRARELVEGLDPALINWRSEPGVWSIGQCLHHLCVMNDVYLPALSAALDGQPQSVVDRLVPGRFGRWFIRNYVDPSPTTKRVPSPGKIRPDEQIDPAILELFLRSNQHAKDVVRQAAAFDVNRIRYKNPLAPLVRFSVGTGLEIIWKHQSRHLLQAERIKQSPAFPKHSLAS